MEAFKFITPELDFFSAGIHAKDNAEIPSGISALAKEWGLHHFPVTSTSVKKYIATKEDFDVVLVADRNVGAAVLSLGFPKEKIFSMTDDSIPSSIRPFILKRTKNLDINGESFARNMCSCIASSRQILNSKILNDHNQSNKVELIVIPQKIGEYEIAEYLFKTYPASCLPTILDLRKKNKRRDTESNVFSEWDNTWKSNSIISDLIFLKHFLASTLSLNPQYFCPIFFNPFKVAFSDEFRRAVFELKKLRSLCILVDMAESQATLSMEALIFAAYSEEIKFLK